jgi:hypothetical protein
LEIGKGPISTGLIFASNAKFFFFINLDLFCTLIFNVDEIRVIFGIVGDVNINILSYLYIFPCFFARFFWG